MKKIFLPLFSARSRITGSKTVFYANEATLEIRVPSALMKTLLDVCDGTKTDKEVIGLVSKDWDSATVVALLNALRRHSLVVDARCMNEQDWNVVKNPSPFPNSLTEKDVAKLVKKATERHQENPSLMVYPIQKSGLNSLLEERRSVRAFSGEPVDFQNIVGLLWSAYGAHGAKKSRHVHRTVPSAGALYPLLIHLALFQQVKNLSPAIYSVYLGARRSVGFKKESSDILKFKRSFLDPLMMETACGAITISGSFAIGGEKYGNRGMLYVPLEAGHAAQNIHLSATESNVATVEIGGFVDELIAEAVHLPANYHPLTTVVFGMEKKFPGQEHPSDVMDLQWAIPMSGKYRPAFSNASVRLSPKRSWSHGRDVSPKLAYIKAVAEAKEWTACGNLPESMISARFTDLPTAVDPQSIIKFHPLQYRDKHFPFGPFDRSRKYEWTEGRDEFSGSSVRILADLVYFPYFPKTPYYAYANSSGVAAHPNSAKALEISLLELIERDAFMITYLARLRMPIVGLKSLPSIVQKRVRDMRSVGFRTWIADISIDLAPVMFVFSQSSYFHCTTCSAAADFNAENALDHALLEVESFVLARMQNGPAKNIKPTDVAMPLDHGMLYEQARYFRMADFLVGSRKRINFRDAGNNTATSSMALMSQLEQNGYRLLSIPLRLSDQYGGNDGIHIVRSLVPGLVPMTFGFGQSPLGMQRIYAVAKMFGHGNMSYRELTKFPHPFA